MVFTKNIMNKVPRFLYRGDTGGNKTLPERFYFDGLFSKLLQSGNPAHISKYGIYNSIKAHIAPNKKSEFDFYKKTHFLSFTECKDTALFYSSNMEPSKLISTPKYKERRYLFTFNLFSHDTTITNISTGIYKFEYKCNRQLIEPNSLDTPELFSLQKENCWICQNNTSHNLIILDIVSILGNNSKYQLNSLAFENAKRDKEWLILPFDYNNELLGYNSKIPRADFWSAELFRLKSEPEKTIEESLQGMII